MALTRKMLKAMGIEEEKIDEIIEAHTETVEGLKAYKADAEKLAQVQKELDSLKSKQNDSDDFEEKYNNLKNEFDKYKAEVEEGKKFESKKNAFSELIKDAGLSEKGAEKAMKYTDFNSIELDDNGKIKNSGDHLKSLKEEWAEYVVKEGEKGADVTNPPGNDGNSKMSKEDILKIKDTTERQKAMAENHELFGI